MLKNPSLTRHRTEAFPKVKAFLDSIERNSSSTSSVHHLGLSCVQDFLDNPDFFSPSIAALTIETILQPLAKNEIREPK